MLKIDKIVKSVCVHLIPHIHSPMKGFFAYISGDHNYVSRYKSYVFKLSGLSRRDKISFGAICSQDIPSLTAVLEHFQINQIEQERTVLFLRRDQPKHLHSPRPSPPTQTNMSFRVTVIQCGYTQAFRRITYSIVNMDHDNSLPSE